VTRIGLVGCSSTKLNRPAPARELYTSPLFKKASAYAEATCDRWYVLSAKYGLIPPDTELYPYDQRLVRRGHHWMSADERAWADLVERQLREALRWTPEPRLIVLAGAAYRDLLDHGQWSIEAPLRGLGIGQQLAWLTRELAAPAA
jgi:hypothetical protein